MAQNRIRCGILCSLYVLHGYRSNPGNVRRRSRRLHRRLLSQLHIVVKPAQGVGPPSNQPPLQIGLGAGVERCAPCSDPRQRIQNASTAFIRRRFSVVT